MKEHHIHTTTQSSSKTRTQAHRVTWIVSIKSTVEGQKLACNTHFHAMLTVSRHVWLFEKHRNPLTIHHFAKLCYTNQPQNIQPLNFIHKLQNISVLKNMHPQTYKQTGQSILHTIYVNLLLLKKKRVTYPERWSRKAINDSTSSFANCIFHRMVIQWWMGSHKV